MDGAALIVGIGGAVIVISAALVEVMMVGGLGDAGTGVIGKVLLGRGDVLKVNGDQRRDTGQLGDQKEAQQPASEVALDA